jgi:hypothetical protein
MPNQDVFPEQVRIASIILAREEDLEGTLLGWKAGEIALLTTGALNRCEGNLSVDIDDPCLQRATIYTSGPQYLDRCV